MRFDVIEPFKLYLVDGRNPKCSDIRVILAKVSKRHGKYNLKAVDEYAFKELIDLSYDAVALVSNDKTVMLKSVLSFLNDMCRSLQIRIDSNMEFARLYFEGKLTAYEFLRSGSPNSIVILTYLDKTDSRSLFRRSDVQNNDSRSHN